MELSVFERLNLLNILPKEGDITTIRLVRELREKLSFTEEEHNELQITSEGDTVKWKTEDDKGKLIPQTKEIEFGHTAFGIITNALKKLNEQKKIKEEHLELYEKFVEEK